MVEERGGQREIVDSNRKREQKPFCFFAAEVGEKGMVFHFLDESKKVHRLQWNGKKQEEE